MSEIQISICDLLAKKAADDIKLESEKTNDDLSLKQVLKNLTCDTCLYMIEFLASNCSTEFSNKCPYRDTVDTTACLKHTELQKYLDNLIN